MEVIIIAGQIGRLCRKSEASDGRDASQSIGQALEKCLGFFRGVAVAHRIDEDKGHGLRVKVGLNAIAFNDAEDKESSDEKEQKRAGDLRSHGQIAESEALVARKLESCALFHRRGDVGIGGLEGGKEAETD